MSFIAVMGISGCGKTEIVNSLVKRYPILYQRAKSFTTRSKRVDEGEEYNFVTSDELSLMLLNGEIRYIDEAYGYQYAMHSSVFNRLDVDVVKEIHPRNIKALEQFCRDVITVAIIPHGKVDVRGREEDISYGTLSVNIEMINDFTKEIDEIADNLSRRIQAFKLQRKLNIPEYHVIDDLNQKAYSSISREFDDVHRITTANFHQCSKQFFLDRLSVLGEQPGLKIIEIGSGNGWLEEISGFALPSIDLSETMSAGFQQRHIGIMELNNKSQQYDYVFSSLCDPYFYPEAVARMVEILKPNGRICISLPGWEWSQINRRSKNTTTFISQSGEEIEAYSFIPSKLQIEQMGAILGFEIEEYFEGHLDPESTFPISPAISKPAAEAGVCIYDICIVECYMLKRGPIYGTK